MTLSATTNRVQYSPGGSTTSFPITFIFWDNDDPQVTLTTSGVDEVWVRGTQYTITFVAGQTGTLNVVTSPTDYTPASGTTLTIKSNLALTQPTNLPAGGSLDSSALEQQLDQIVRQNQQIDETIGRGLTYPVSDSSSLSAEIPNSSDRASARLGFDSSGEPVAITTDVTGAAATAFGKTLIEASNAAAGRVVMEIVTPSEDDNVIAVQSFSL